MDKSELELRYRKKVWWTGTKRGEIFKLVTQGKSVQEICEAINSRRHAVQVIIAHPYFLIKLEAYLKDIFFHHQTNRILALHEVFQLYWDIIVGRKTVDGLTKDQASKHFTKLMDLKEKEPKVFNPQQFNIIMNILKTPPDPEKIKDMGKEFGFEGLEVPEGEGLQVPRLSEKYEKSNNHPQLDQGKKHQNEQGSED